MTLVFFRGYGAWIIRKNKDIKFLYPRLQPEEYRGHLTIMSDNYGDHFDTIDEIECREYIGVFKLNPIDSAIYECTKQLDVSQIKTLLPCAHEHSVFNQLMEEGRAVKSDFYDCEFEIQRTFILLSHTTERYPDIKFLDTHSTQDLATSTPKIISKSIHKNSKGSIDVYFNGSGTWFDKRDGSLIYPQSDEKCSYFSFPPRHQLFGVFSINNEEDILTYEHTGNFDHVSKLLPNDHLNSAFLKMVDDDVFSKTDIDHYFFQLPRKRKNKKNQRFERKENVLVIANKGESKNKLRPVDKRRVETLEGFIKWIESYDIQEFNKMEIECTKDQLFLKVVEWVVKTNHEYANDWQGIQGSKGEGKYFDSCGQLWTFVTSTKICNVKPSNDRRKNNDYKNIFEKHIFKF